MRFVQQVLVGLDWAILGFFGVVNSFYAVLLVSAAWEMRDHLHRIHAESRWRVLRSEVAPSISLLAPAHNEAADIAESVQAMLGLHYPDVEVIVINDGSTDGTMAVLGERFELVPVNPIYSVWNGRLPGQPHLRGSFALSGERSRHTEGGTGRVQCCASGLRARGDGRVEGCDRSGGAATGS